MHFRSRLSRFAIPLYAVFFMPDFRARPFSSFFILFFACVHIHPGNVLPRRMTYISNAFPYANRAKGETPTANCRLSMRNASYQWQEIAVRRHSSIFFFNNGNFFFFLVRDNIELYVMIALDFIHVDIKKWN